MDAINEFLMHLVGSYPWLSLFFMVLGVLRSVFKPLMSVLHAYVMATPSTTDDMAVANFEAGKIYKSIVWVVDYLSSIKLPMPAKK